MANTRIMSLYNGSQSLLFREKSTRGFCAIFLLKSRKGNQGKYGVGCRKKGPILF